jgi:hypothetical protein
METVRFKVWQQDEITITKTKTVRRFTFKNLIKSFLEVFELDSGVIYSIKGLFVKPGEIIKGYIDTERFKVISPLRYFLIIIGLATFLTMKLDFWQQQFSSGFSSSSGIQDKKELENIILIFNQVFLDYLNAWFGLMVFFQAIFSKFLFLKSSFTFLEHIVVNLFISSHQTLIFLPFIGLSFFGIDTSLISMVVIFVYLIWSFKSVFGESWLKTIFKSFLIFIGSLVLFFIFLTISIAIAL